MRVQNQYASDEQLALAEEALDISIGPMTAEDSMALTMLIRSNLGAFEEVGSVLASAFRRVEDIHRTYTQDGSCYLVAREKTTGHLLGGAGIGPLAGLPASEGIGEIRELVIEGSFRGKGYGRALLNRCILEAGLRGYRRIYLETTPQMINARRLFEKFGFRPVTQAPSVTGEKKLDQDFPCYYLYEAV